MGPPRYILPALLGAVLFTPVLSSPAMSADKANEELRMAIEQNDVAAMKSALSQGAGVNAQFSHGSTALMLAAEAGDINIARTLLARGADIHSRCGCGWTVLMHAAAGGDNVTMLQLLMAHGAAVNEKTSRKRPQNGLQTALQAAAFFGSAANTRFLLAQGATVNMTNAQGETALQIALKSKHTSGDVVSLLKAAAAKEQ